MKHPYTAFEASPMWTRIDEALSALERNKDLALTTARPHVIGYLCQELAEVGPVQAASADEPHLLYRLLRELESTSIHFALARTRPDTVRIDLTLVGERVEVDVFEDGHCEVSRFRGSEAVEGDEVLVRQLIAEQSQ